MGAASTSCPSAPRASTSSNSPAAPPSASTRSSPALYTGRACFQLFHPAPRRPGTLLGIDGSDEVKRIPGVTLHRPYARPGTRFPGGVQTLELDIVMGEARDLAELAVLAKDIESTLRYRFAFEGDDDTPDTRPTTTEVTGAELGAL